MTDLEKLWAKLRKAKIGVRWKDKTPKVRPALLPKERDLLVKLLEQAIRTGDVPPSSIEVESGLPSTRD